MPSSSWKTIEALNLPNVSGIKWILKGSSCPKVIINLSSIFIFCSINSFFVEDSLFDYLFIFFVFDFLLFVAFDFVL